MLIFGHEGITIGVIKLYEKVTRRNNPKNDNFIDYRMAMAGALLPDIIDKPIVHIIYGLQNREGHFIAHSFIFSGLLIIIGIIISSKNKNRNIFLIGLCSLIHQLLDKIISLAGIFFLSQVYLSYFRPLERFQIVHYLITPIYIKFPYLSGVLVYFEKPYVFIPEVMGFIIIVYFIDKLYKSKEYMKFLKYGRL